MSKNDVNVASKPLNKLEQYMYDNNFTSDEMIQHINDLYGASDLTSQIGKKR